MQRLHEMMSVSRGIEYLKCYQNIWYNLSKYFCWPNIDHKSHFPSHSEASSYPERAKTEFGNKKTLSDSFCHKSHIPLVPGESSGRHILVSSSVTASPTLSLQQTFNIKLDQRETVLLRYKTSSQHVISLSQLMTEILNIHYSLINRINLRDRRLNQPTPSRLLTFIKNYACKRETIPRTIKSKRSSSILINYVLIDSVINIFQL